MQLNHSPLNQNHMTVTSLSIGSTIPTSETYRTEFVEVDDELQNSMNAIGSLWNDDFEVMDTRS